jgi:hypothetical protein
MRHTVPRHIPKTVYFIIRSVISLHVGHFKQISSGSICKMAWILISLSEELIILTRKGTELRLTLLTVMNAGSKYEDADRKSAIMFKMLIINWKLKRNCTIADHSLRILSYEDYSAHDMTVISPWTNRSVTQTEVWILCAPNNKN